MEEKKANDLNPWAMENIAKMEIESIVTNSSWLEMNVTSNCDD